MPRYCGGYHGILVTWYHNDKRSAQRHPCYSQFISTVVRIMHLLSLLSAFSALFSIFAIAMFALLLWGLVLFFAKRGDETLRTRGKRYIRFGAVGIITLLILWVVVITLQQTIGPLNTLGVAHMRAPIGFAPSEDYGRSFDAVDKVMNESTAVSQPVIDPIPPIPGGDAPVGDTKIIRTGSLSLVVADIYAAAAEIREISAALGGQPGMENFSEYTKGSLSGNMTIWVPSERFDEALTRIEALAIRVTNRTVNARDVSAQFVDLEARLKNLRATETQIAEILKRSGKISEVLEVTRELARTRGEIEHIQGQLNHLARQVALSSISVSLSQEVNPAGVRDEWEPLVVLKTAARNMLHELTRMADRMIEFLVWLPIIALKLFYWLAIIFIVWKIGKFGYRKFRANLTELIN